MADAVPPDPVARLRRTAFALAAALAAAAVVAGAARLEAEQAGHLNLVAGVALMTGVSVALGWGVCWWAYLRLRGAEAARAEATAALAERNARLEAAQAEAERATQRWRTLFDASPDGLIITRPDGTVVDLNAGAERLWGLPRERFLDPAFRMASLYADPEDRPRIIAHLMQGRRHEGLEVRMKRGDGAVRTLLFNSHAMDLGGERVFLAAGRDITQLREAEQRFRAMFEANPIALAISRGDGAGLLDVNPAYTHLLGYTRDEVLAPGFTASRLWVHPEGRKALLDRLAAAGQVDGLELEMRRKDGATRTVVVSIQRVQVQGEAAYLSGLQDVTEARAASVAAQRARERFERIFRASPVAISLTKDEGAILDANDAFARMTGYTRDELLNQVNAVQLYEEPDERRRLVLALRSSGAVRERELHWRRKDGAPLTLLASLEFVDVGGATTILGLYQDLGERLRLEREREARLASEAELERLRRTDEFRTQFINSAAHELSTPLTPLALTLSTLRAARADEAVFERQLATLQRAADRLRRVIGDMVSAADLQARDITLDRARLNLGRQLRAAVAAHHAAAHRANLALDEPADPGLQVLADEQRLQLVLGHLLGNAIKFTPAGGRVWLEARRDGEQARVEVHDTGVGLTRRQLDQLWKPYVQAHDKAERTDSGSGLGLYVSKGIVDLHKGEVGAASPGPGKGSTFWFTLPLAPGSTVPTAHRPPPEEAPRPKAGRLDLDGHHEDEVSPSRA